MTSRSDTTKTHDTPAWSRWCHWRLHCRFDSCDGFTKGWISAVAAIGNLIASQGSLTPIPDTASNCQASPLISSSDKPSFRSRFLDSTMLKRRKSLFVPVMLPSFMAEASTVLAVLLYRAWWILISYQTLHFYQFPDSALPSTSTRLWYLQDVIPSSTWSDAKHCLMKCWAPLLGRCLASSMTNCWHGVSTLHGSEFCSAHIEPWPNYSHPIMGYPSSIMTLPVSPQTMPRDLTKTSLVVLQYPTSL